MTTREYTNGEITVLWQPSLCIHCKNCTRGLPKVFDPSRRPWVVLDGHTSEAIIEQVNMCPSGALSIKETHP